MHASDFEKEEKNCMTMNNNGSNTSGLRNQGFVYPTILYSMLHRTEHLYYLGVNCNF